MMKVILGLISIGGLSLGAIYVYTGFESGGANLPGGGCCHSSKTPASVSCSSEATAATASTEPAGSCCALPSRSVSAKKASCCEAPAKGVEVLTVAPREVAAK